MDEKIRIALSTGSEELNNAIIKSTDNNNYEYSQVHYREFFFDNEVKHEYNICIISKLLPGEKDFDTLIFLLKSKGVRVIMILLDQDKEELETCIKYQISDAFTQPVKPIEILNTIETPKTFKDIEFIYKKLGLKFEIEENKQERTKKPLMSFLRKKPKGNSEIETIKRDTFKSAEVNDENKINIIEPAHEQTEIEIQKEYRLVRAKKISFVNLSQGAGSTFLTLNTAYAMCEFGLKPSVVEFPDSKADLFYQISDEEGDYVPLTWEIENDKKDYKNSIYKKDGINFYINDGKYSYSKWDMDKNIKYINVITANSDINIFDVGNSIDNYVLKSSDKIFVVVDPAPNKLKNAINRLQEINALSSEYAIKVTYIFNKWSDKLDRKDIEKYLQIKSSICINFVSPEICYEAAYKSKAVYQRKEGKIILKEGLDKIINQILPMETKRLKRFMK